MNSIRRYSILATCLGLVLQASATLAQDDGIGPQLDAEFDFEAKVPEGFDDQAIRLEIQAQSAQVALLAESAARDAAKQAASDFMKEIARSMARDFADAPAMGDFDESDGDIEIED